MPNRTVITADLKRKYLTFLIGSVVVIAAVFMVNHLSRLGLYNRIELAGIYIMPQLSQAEELLKPKSETEDESSVVAAGTPVAVDLRGGLVERGAYGYHGRLVDVLELAFEKTGVDGNLVTLSNSMSQLEMLRGRPMLKVGYGKMEVDLVSMENPLIGLQMTLFSRADRKFRYSALESSSPLRVGIVEGDTLPESFERLLSRFREGQSIVIPANGEAAFDRLLDSLFLGRVDVIFASPLMMEIASRSLGIPEGTFVEVEGAPSLEWNVYLARQPDADPEARRLFSAIERWLENDSARESIKRIAREGGLGSEARREP